jgi:hypothetical protein
MSAFLPRLAKWLSLVGLVAPASASAQINPCPLGAIVPCATGGAAGAYIFVATEVIPEMKILFAGFLLIFFVYYAMRLLLESGEESTQTEVKAAYGYAVSGAVLVSVASLIALSVGNEASGTLINSDPGGPAQTAIDLVITYLQWLMGTAVLIFIAFQGVRLVILHGQDAEAEKQKTRFFHGLAGVAIVILANTIVGAVAGSQASLLGTQGKAAVDLMLEIFGILVILSFIVAGVMLVISTDEGLKDRAKKIFYAGIVGMIVVFSAFMIVTFVLEI